MVISTGASGYRCGRTPDRRRRLLRAVLAVTLMAPRCGARLHPDREHSRPDTDVELLAAAPECPCELRTRRRGALVRWARVSAQAENGGLRYQ